MDLLFGRFADGALNDLSDAELSAFEALMTEADDELFLWIAGAGRMPARHRHAIERIRAFHGIGSDRCD